MGNVFAGLAVREPQPRASEAFRLFAEQHRNMEKLGNAMIKKVKPVSYLVGQICKLNLNWNNVRFWTTWARIFIKPYRILV